MMFVLRTGFCYSEVKDVHWPDGMMAECKDMKASPQTRHYAQLYGEPVYYLLYKGAVFIYALQKFWRH
jgi:hypothetical protein